MIIMVTPFLLRDSCPQRCVAEAHWLQRTVQQKGNRPRRSMAKRSYPTSEVRAVARRSYPMPEVRGSGREELPHVQRAVAMWAQEG